MVGGRLVTTKVALGLRGHKMPSELVGRWRVATLPVCSWLKATWSSCLRHTDLLGLLHRSLAPFAVATLPVFPGPMAGAQPHGETPSGGRLNGWLHTPTGTRSSNFQV